MKQVILLLLLAYAGSAFSQDTIVKKDGGFIPSKVVEITDISVKYKIASNPEGPVYNVPLNEVREIKYANGNRDMFYVPAPAAPANSKYDSLMKASRGSKLLGTVFCITGPIEMASGAALVGLGIGISDKADIAIGSLFLIAGTMQLIAGPLILQNARKNKTLAQQHKSGAYLSLPSPVINYAFGSQPGYGLGVRLTW